MLQQRQVGSVFTAHSHAHQLITALLLYTCGAEKPYFLL